MSSFARPTLTELIIRIQADITAKLPRSDSRLRRNVLNVLARVFAGVMFGLYGLLSTLSKFLPDEAEGTMLLRWGAIMGKPRIAATAAAGNIALSGIDGSVVPAGTIVARSDGTRYATSASATITGGSAIATITAEATGDAGNMVAGQALNFVSPIGGVNAVAVVAAGGIAGGADEESEERHRARILERMREQPAGGKATDYVAWAKEVAGVTRAWPYENWDGLGTVKLLFVMDDREDIIPEAGDVSIVGNYIGARRPLGAEVTVAAPTAQPLNFTIALTPDTAEVRAAVAAELDDLIAREAEPAGTLLISHMREAISTAAGETDHVMSSPTANQTAGADAIFVLGTITWA
ncbi:baseplate J/gp47 family protein [Sphingobium yanoikuyae]|uniref:Baseplate J protein n=1 Tax=Sphingobium yanoikuyae TaxID=13690 RepID=A0A430BX03_SPHYA|nr:baseplate J/gp47 family protein [Sphingobium yanoikuyae]RSU57183.1 baseplate J protein [Sphingobium yanoikuyae]